MWPVSQQRHLPGSDGHSWPEKARRRFRNTSLAPRLLLHSLLLPLLLYDLPQCMRIRRRTSPWTRREQTRTSVLLGRMVYHLTQRPSLYCPQYGPSPLFQTP